MATDLRRFLNIGASNVIDPLNNAYWSTSNRNSANGPESLGNGDGTGVYDWAGLEGLGYNIDPIRQQMAYGDETPVQPGAQAYADFLASNGLTLREQNLGDTAAMRYLTNADGGLVGDINSVNYDDSQFWSMASLMAGLATGGIASAAGASGAAAGAVGGAVKGGMQDGSIQGALKGAALGGIAGGVSDYLGAGQSIDPAATEYGYMNQMDLASDAMTPISLPSGFGDMSSITGPLDQAYNWQPAQMGETLPNLQQLPQMGQLPDIAALGNSQVGALPDFGNIQPVGQYPDFNAQLSQQVANLPTPNDFAFGLPSIGDENGDPVRFETTGTRETPTLQSPLTNYVTPEAGAGIAAGAGAFTLPNIGTTATPNATVPKGLSFLDALNSGGLGAALDTVTPGGLLQAGTIAAGAVAGSQGNPGGTQTTQSRTDPRIDPFIYGAGGLLDSAKSVFDSNRSGVNPTMQQGWNQQLGLLGDTGIAEQLAKFRTQGAGGLLGSGIAANPFTTGAARLRG